MDLKAIWEMSDKWDGRQKPSMEEEYLVTKEESLDASIELYWGVIGICAADLNVSVEGLALKVLAHEWGHAYTHVGLDIDGTRWPSDGFSETDKAVKEGLAQFCALKVVEDLKWGFPEGLDAYNAILPRQPKIYRTHLG